MKVFWSVLLLAASIAGLKADIVDSVVAVVDSQAIKHSDVIREIRLTDFLNHEKLDLSKAAQKEAVNRLIDQAVIRQEIDAGMYVPSDPDQAAALLDQVRQSYGGASGFSKALASYGITEEELKNQLAWQTAVLEFIQLRFGTNEKAAAQAAQGTSRQASSGNDDFFAWLDQMRKDRRIVIHEERLK
jgi:hypothetical protein